MPGLSEPVRRFLIAEIASIERLDILLLMNRHADDWWTAPHIAHGLRIPLASVQMHLDSLGQLNLMAVRIAQDVLYRYSPASQEMRDMVEAIALAYDADRHALAALMGRSPNAASPASVGD